MASNDFLEILRSERRDLLARLRQTRLSTLKEGYSHSQIVPFSTYSPWLDDAGFQEVYSVAKGATLVDLYRCYELHQLGRQAAAIDGDIVEVGVWRGGTALLMGKGAQNKKLHLFDTFEGVPKASTEFDTLYVGGEHSDTSAEGVRRLMADAGLAADIHIGIFPDDTLDALPAAIALAHIDVDTYISGMECFEACWPRVSVGGMVVFDDYGFFGCEGVTQAVHELKRKFRGYSFVHNLNGHAIFIKLDESWR